MLRIRVVQCLCTQCEGELLHLYEVCLPVISVEHMSQDVEHMSQDAIWSL